MVMNADAGSACAGHGDGGIIDAVGDVAVFQVIGELFRCHIGTVILCFGGACSEVGNAENIFFAEEGFVGEVGDIAGDFPLGDGICHVGTDDEIAARVIDDNDAVLTQCKRVLIEHSLGVGCERNVYGDKVTGLQNSIEIGSEFDASIDHPCALDGEEGVIADDFHAEGEGCVCDHCPDGAKPDDAQFFADDFLSHKLAFSFFDFALSIFFSVMGYASST